MRTYLIVYLNRKKEILYRIVKNLPPYEKNTYTSMGWYIIDIQVYYNGSFHSLDYFKKNIKKDIELQKKKDKKIIIKNKIRKKISNKLIRIANKI